MCSISDPADRLSIALSIKMNILLFAPAFALTMLLDVGLTQTVWNGLLIGSSQVRRARLLRR